MENFEKKIRIEIKNAVASVKGSYLNDESNTDGKGGDGSGYGQEYIQSTLGQKVNIQDFNRIINTKTNKKDTVMIYDQICEMHKQLLSISLLI